MLLLCKHIQSFKCDNFLSKPLCPGTVAQCSCVITVNTSYIRWNFTNLDVCPSSENLISLSQVCADTITGSCGPYLHAAIIPSGSNLCNTSILTIEADTSLDGLIIECRDPNTAIYPGALVGSVNVTIAAGVKRCVLLCIGLHIYIPYLIIIYV